MKKFLVLMLVLGMASLANATLQISVDGDVGLDEITIAPSDYICLDLTAEGTEDGSAYWLNIDGPGLVDIANVVQYVQDGPVEAYIIDLGPAVGHDQTIMMDLLIPGSVVNILPEGTVVDLLMFHCEGLGDVTVSVFDSNTGATLDTLTIHQIPEPMTLALLGLGGLFLRRRK